MLQTNNSTIIFMISSYVMLSMPTRVMAESFQEKQVRQANQAVLDRGQILVNHGNERIHDTLNQPATDYSASSSYAVGAGVNFDITAYAGLFQAAAEQERNKVAQKEAMRSLILKRYETDKSPSFMAYLRKQCSQASLNSKYLIAGYATAGAGIAVMLGGLLGYVSSDSHNASQKADDRLMSILIPTLAVGSGMSLIGLLFKPVLSEKDVYLRPEDCIP